MIDQENNGLEIKLRKFLDKTDWSLNQRFEMLELLIKLKPEKRLELAGILNEGKEGKPNRIEKIKTALEPLLIDESLWSVTQTNFQIPGRDTAFEIPNGAKTQYNKLLNFLDEQGGDIDDLLTRISVAHNALHTKTLANDFDYITQLEAFSSNAITGLCIVLLCIKRAAIDAQSKLSRLKQETNRKDDIESVEYTLRDLIILEEWSINHLFDMPSGGFSVIQFPAITQKLHLLKSYHNSITNITTNMDNAGFEKYKA